MELGATFDLTDMVVLIAGPTGGVGPSVAHACLEAGAKIVLVSRSHDKLEDLAASLGLPETDCLLHTADLTKPEAVREAVAATVGCFGRIDAVVSLVGHWEPGKIASTTPERWHAVLTTNLHSLFYLLHEAVPHMSAGGAIVTLGNELPVEGKGGQLAYAVSKAGVHTMVQSLALELRPRQIRVNAILPSDIDTPDNRKYRPTGDPDKWVKPADVAQLVLFLLSPAALQISGALVPIRGWEVVN